MKTARSDAMKSSDYGSFMGYSFTSAALAKEIMYNSGYSNSGGFSNIINTNSYMNTSDDIVPIGGLNLHGRIESPNTNERDCNRERHHNNFLTNYTNLSSPAVTSNIKTESSDNSFETYDNLLPPNNLLLSPTQEKAPFTKQAKKFGCTYCDKMFAKKQQLQNHTKTHTKEKNFKCDTCHKGFIHKQQLMNHEKTHTGCKDFKCSYCNKCFMLKQQLQIHEKIHTGEKNFACNMCEKAFITKQQLQNHINSHLGIKPFTCSECHKKFAHKQQLERHTKNHALKQNHNCVECNAKFLTKTAYSEHLKEIHARPRWGGETTNIHSEIFTNSTS